MKSMNTCRTVSFFLAGAVAAVVVALNAGGAQAADDANACGPLALRAAKADAVSQLAKGLAEMPLREGVPVGQLLSTTAAQTELVDWLSLNARPVGEAEVDGQQCRQSFAVNGAGAAELLRSIHGRHYKGTAVTAADLAAPALATVGEVTAEGVARPADYRPLAPLGPTSNVTAGSIYDPNHLLPPAREFWQEYATPAGQRMAVRSASIDGLQRLEKLAGELPIGEGLTVAAFVAESDKPDVAMKRFLLAARETAVRFQAEDLIVEVDHAITVQAVLAQVKAWGELHYTGGEKGMKQLEQAILDSAERTLTQTGFGAPPKHERFVRKRSEAIFKAMALAEKTPLWAGRTLSATADAEKPAPANLRARRELIDKLSALNVPGRGTVGELARDNAAFARAFSVFCAGIDVADTPAATARVQTKPLWNAVFRVIRR